MDTQGSQQRKQRLLTAACALLPIATLPLELGQGAVGLGGLLLTIFLVIALREEVFRARLPLTAVEKTMVVLIFWVTARNFFLSPLAGDGFNVAFAVRDTGLLLGAIAVYRLGRIPHLHRPILRGLGFALVLTLAIEAYQLAAGLPQLVAQGYTSADGYYYATVDGTYRPFGTFTGPTTFGTFLAMLGGFVALGSSGRSWRWFAGLATVAGVLATQTRAAMLGVIAAVILLALLTAPARRALGAIAIPGGLAAVAVFLARPDLWVRLAGRLLSAAEQTDTSRVTRLQLWEGVVQATADRGRLIEGFASTPWLELMSGEVGALSALGHAHSNFFQMWFRYGLVGALMFVAVSVALIWVTVQAQKAGRQYATSGMLVAVVYLFDSLFNNSLSSTNFTLAAFLLVGLAASPKPQLGERDCPPDAGVGRPFPADVGTGHTPAPPSA